MGVGQRDTDPSSKTYNMIKNTFGYCVKTNTSSPTKCPPRYKKIGPGLQCRDCNSNCDCEVSGTNYSTRKCTLCYDNYKFRYGSSTTSCSNICYQTTSNFGKFKYPLIGVNKCGYTGDGDCAHVLAKNPDCIGCYNKYDTYCPRCKNTVTTFLYEGNCYEKGITIPGYYWQSNSYLYRCPNGCKKCTSNVYNQCSECMDWHSLKRNSGTRGICVLKCPTGYSSVNKICLHCHSSCKECSAEDDARSCTSCNPPNVLTPNKVCDPNGCPDGYYIAPGSVCATCNTAFCLTCYGATSSNCLSCHSEKYLKTDTSECVTKCPSNYYYKGDKCYPCDPSCATCDNPTKTSCLTCHSGYLLQVDKSCQSSCIKGSFQEPGTTSCVRCANLCESCTSQAIEDCNACSPVALKLSNNACAGNCTINWYQVKSTRNCKRCNISCLSCKGPTSTDCTACHPGVTFVAATNTCKCTSTGQYFDLGYCLPCHSTCDTCNGPLETNCLTCPQTTFFIPETKKCVSKCPIRTYSEKQACTPCHEKCLACTGTTEKDCTLCKSYYEYLSETQECISCNSKEKVTEDKECSFVKLLELREETTNPDYYSSNTVEVFFSKLTEHKSFLNKLDTSKLPEYMKV